MQQEVNLAAAARGERFLCVSDSTCSRLTEPYSEPSRSGMSLSLPAPTTVCLHRPPWQMWAMIAVCTELRTASSHIPLRWPQPGECLRSFAQNYCTEALDMNRRLALMALGTLACGCRGRVKSYDRKPKGGPLEDRWAGWYFNRVQASYSLPLHKPDPSLSRALGPPVVVESSNTHPEITLPSVSTVPPSHADVQLNYNLDDDAADARREVSVTLLWPNLERDEASGSAPAGDSRSGRVEFADIRDFLEGSGRFRVHRHEHYYGVIQQEGRQMFEHDNQLASVNVDLQISGPSPDSHLSRTLVYRVTYHLFELAELAWPGIG